MKWHVVCFGIALWGAGLPGAEEPSAWIGVSPGVEYREFALGLGDSVAHVVRVDAAQAPVRVMAVGPRELPRSVREWSRDHNLVFAANAGMFAEDRRTHIGYLKIEDEELIPRIHPTYHSALLLHPSESRFPPFKLLDTDQLPLELWKTRYGTVVQNLRLIKRSRENRWSENRRRWSEMALGEDASGRMVFIFTPVPYTMYEWNRRMLALPLDLIAAQHLEGGSEAQFFLRLPDRDLYLSGGWLGEMGLSMRPVPNVIGISSPK